MIVALIDRLLSAINASPSVTYHDSAIHDASIYALAGQEEAAIATLDEWVSRGALPHYYSKISGMG